MKNTIILFSAFLMFANFSNAQDHEYHGESKNQPKHFNNFVSAEVPLTFVGDTTLVGLKLNLHLNFFHKEDALYCFTIIIGGEGSHEDTITHFMVGAGRKWIFGNDAVLEAAIVVGAEQPFLHPRFGTTVTYHSPRMDCFMSFDYGFRSKFFYRTYAIWYPERHFGLGGEVQKHSPTGIILCYKPCPRFSVRVVNGIDLGYVFGAHDVDGSTEPPAPAYQRFKWASMFEVHIDF